MDSAASAARDMNPQASLKSLSLKVRVMASRPGTSRHSGRAARAAVRAAGSSLAGRDMGLRIARSVPGADRRAGHAGCSAAVTAARRWTRRSSPASSIWCWPAPARVRRSHASPSTLCTSCTQIEPSPTADATRFTFPERTSPTANTPGRVVSSKYGWRASGHSAATRSSRLRSVPVLTNPRSSITTHLSSHWLLGSAPVMTNTWRIGRVSASFSRAQRQRTRSRPTAPSSASIWV